MSSAVAADAVATAAARVRLAPSIALIAFAPFVAVVVRALSAVLLSYELLPPPLSSLLLLSSPEDNGLDPIVESEILLDGDHPIERTLEVAEKVWSEVFFYLAQNNVIFEGILLKPSMVTPGAEHKETTSPETIAKYTLTMLRRRVPPAVPRIMFLSGGQSEVEATLNLNAMNQSPNPWHISFSYARALQNTVLKTWQRRPENVEAAQKSLG
ncbi:fructose-bisphosphate aldolase 3, chloroplastic-like [Arachis hypogaea]